MRQGTPEDHSSGTIDEEVRHRPTSRTVNDAWRKDVKVKWKNCYHRRSRAGSLVLPVQDCREAHMVWTLRLICPGGRMF